MKKIFSLQYLLMLVITTSQAQQIDVPGAVIKAFEAKFPGATEIKWEKENRHELEASFSWNNTKVSANFRLDGTWTETETTLASSGLPEAVALALDSRYPGSSVLLAERIEKPGSKIIYEVNIKAKKKHHELERDAEGNFIK